MYLELIEAILAGATIVIGGIVEGYGYGLSLGTSWPYSRDFTSALSKGDPEAIHRMIATIIGILAILLIPLSGFSLISILGLVSVIITALLGMATLYVLAGKLPSVFQGFHDIAAYTTFVIYLIMALRPDLNILNFLIEAITPPHFLYFVIFMGGVVTGSRRMKYEIGNILRPKNSIQVAWLIHGIATIVFLISLILYTLNSSILYIIPLILTIITSLIGLLTYRKINSNPIKPGIFVGLHQLFSLIIVVSLVLLSIS
ncbi:MAG: cytochrome C oxidase assembly protein [Sulfolobaceae archaeon]